ncbi:MAG: hypothetical protein AAFR77_13020 [Cyanobacteria bacterium J06631_2]
MRNCFVHNEKESSYQHHLDFIGGEGNFFGGYANSEGHYLLGLPEDTLVLPWTGVKSPALKEMADKMPKPHSNSINPN